MARPYNLVQVGGEGTYGGLRGLVATPDMIYTDGVNFANSNYSVPPGYAGSPYYGPKQDFSVPVPDQTANQINYLWDAVFGNTESASEAPTPSAGMTIAEWVNSNRTLTFAVVGGVIGLMLFRR